MKKMDQAMSRIRELHWIEDGSSASFFHSDGMVRRHMMRRRMYLLVMHRFLIHIIMDLLLFLVVIVTH